MSDLISRQEVIDEIKGWQNEDRYYHPTWRHDKIPVKEMITRVRGIPGKETISSERKKGKNVRDEVVGYCEFKCSVCGAEIRIVEGGDLDGAYGFKFCPGCGAEMEE